MNNKKVLVTGELNVDILFNEISSFPVIGQEILADKMTLALGSSSAIFAANLSSLGTVTSFCGMVGKDLFGDFILSELHRKQVDTSLISSSEKYQTGVTVVLNYLQDRANVTHCGAMEHLVVDNIPFDRFPDFSHLHLSSYFLQKGLQKDIVRLFKTARDKGLSTSLDIQWDPANEWHFPYQECLPYVDFFMPNEAEILALTHTEQLDGAFQVLDAFANTIIVKRGISGATAYHKGESLHAAPYLHDHFVDAIGAGDSFNAGFINSHLQGKPLYDNLLAGNLAGAISTTAAGGTGAFADFPSYREKANRMLNVKI
ncbi:carbohydrate kinase family protein [Chitinophaga sp. MM2321]|uniref:carbohydrate kinase family protein n=1 Tax=Chitinophaga sp. MM2321 TaxID=3137178 RepID=UPI0032D595AE